MVIPIPSGNMLTGNPPDSVAPRLKIVKYSILTMIACFTGQGISALLIQGLGGLAQLILSGMNLLVNILLGIWLLRSDPTIKRIYDFLAQTCCSICTQDQFPKDLQCLVPFAFCNAITVVLAVLQGAIQADWMIFRLASAVDVFDAFPLWLMLICTAGALISQTVGAIYAYFVWKECQNTGAETYPEIRRPFLAAEQAPPRRQPQFQAFQGEGRTLGTS
eukprot:TRINITY_DN106806_c0_g1_i1.p1 TRINITY_DN106806_c0_g1~~TRINITY_DN106806_c0_g1_i1.p1  ORF type:complete len:244 (-),score=20.92 TRINITY_DN106806_c0_g1_i1:233-889(-)